MKPKMIPMRGKTLLFTGLAATTAVLIPLHAYSLGQLPGQRPRGGGAGIYNSAAVTVNYPAEVKIEVRDSYRYITSNGIPNHTTGQFPSRGNPNEISPQDYHFRVPLEPKAATAQANRGAQVFGPQLFGVAVNGVVFDPGTAELWNGNFRWHYEALTGAMAAQGSLGADENFAHVQPNGAYHYHGLPMGLLRKLDYTKKMALVGWAADGYPVYGPYGYSDPNDPRSPLKMLKSSYRLKSGDRPGGDGPGGAYDGSFQQDYTYVRGAGDLDEFNGRFGVTPEFPKGTFYYVLTDTWPFVPRQFKGVPDSSFSKRGPGGPGMGGGQGRPGGGVQGGFGGPGGMRGPGGRGFGPPPGMVPSSILAESLGLTEAQKANLARLVKAVEALQAERFAMDAFPRLKLTAAQMDRLAKGEKVRDVLTQTQQDVLDANQRPGPGQGGFPGGPEGPGGPPPMGPEPGNE